MRFDFTETDPETFGGALTVTAETPTEVLEVSEHFRLHDKDSVADIGRLAEALKVGSLVHVSNPTKRKWYLVESALDHEFTKPYLDLLCKITGYEGDLPELDLTPYHPRRLCHTHITIECGLEHGHYVYKTADTSEPWNGMTAQAYADKCVQDYAEEELGYRPFEREYIKEGGHIIRNPKYLKRHRPKPSTGSPWLWAVLFRWWLDTHGNDAQREAIAKNDALHAANRSSPEWTVREHGNGASLVGYNGLHTDWNKPPMTWAEFQKLGN